MDTPLTSVDFEQIRLAMSEYDCIHFGLRIVDADRHFSEDEVVPGSRKWVDGVLTNETLPGTSCLSITDKRLSRIAEKLRPYLLNYRRARIMLIGSDSAIDGEDDDEILMQDAFCYWNKVVEVEVPC